MLLVKRTKSSFLVHNTDMALHHRLHELRQRPHHERHAIAAMTAYVVVAVLTLVWAVVFFSDISASAKAARDAQATAATTTVQ